MRIPLFRPFLRIVTDLKFAILVLVLISAASGLGSIVEQDEPLSFYQANYPSQSPLYGFIDWQVILAFGFNHAYTTWWFLSLLALLGICLGCCTLTRQFPLLSTSKDFFFKTQETSFGELPFFIQLRNLSYFPEVILGKLQSMNFFVYQKETGIYGYQGLVGRISPILVHFSLLLILGGACVGAFENFQGQEVLPKGELFHFQNPLRVGFLTSFPAFPIRVNDFWVEYQNHRIHQFYSNLSILNNYGQEIHQQTISVNNPVRFHQIDVYQSDWNLVGIRLATEQGISQLPLFPLQEGRKSWITWIEPNFSLVFDQLENVFFLYRGNTFESLKSLQESLGTTQVLEILSSTGLVLKYDPSIILIYAGFGFLMITTLLSYFPYTQIWFFQGYGRSFLGSRTNRGKIELEIAFENLVRFSENAMVDRLSQKRKT